MPIGDLGKCKRDWTYPNNRKKAVQNAYIKKLLEGPSQQGEEDPDEGSQRV